MSSASASSPLRISLERMRLYGFHGVGEQERKVGAEYELSVSVEMPLPAGCYTDEIADTLSYADLYEVVKREFDKPSQLIEHVATRISRAIFESFPGVQRAGIKLVKVSPPIPGFTGSAAVEIFFEK